LLAFAVILLPQAVRVVMVRPDSVFPDADPIEMKEAGAWIKSQTGHTPIIMSTSHAVDYYAGSLDILNTVTVPQEPVGRVLDYARNRGAEYLVLSERRKADYPLLGFLLEGRDIPAGLTLVWRKTDLSNLSTVIYRIGPS
jgi:hypothetical protein